MKTLSFTDEELQELVALVDGGLRHIGVRAAIPAGRLMQKIEAAMVAPPPKAKREAKREAKRKAGSDQ